jgi:hypothetical protein
VPGGHTRAIKNLRGTSRLLNTLEGKLCRGSTERGELCRALPGGHCAGASVHKENSLLSSKRRVSEGDTHRVVEYSGGRPVQRVHQANT